MLRIDTYAPIIIKVVKSGDLSMLQAYSKDIAYNELSRSICKLIVKESELI